MTAGWGEAAAFCTAFSWSISSYVHGALGRVISATGVTLLRLPYQLALLGALCILLDIGTSVSSRGFFLLFLSGFTGISLSDFMLYRAILTLGPQTSILLISTSAGFTALFGWVFLGEVLPTQAVLGMLVVFSGVVCVLTERTGSTLLPGQEVPKGKKLAAGVLLVLVAAVFQAASFIALKMAMQSGVSPLWAAFMRLLLAAVVLWGVGLLRGWSFAAVRNLREHPSVFWILMGACSFSAGGMWCSSIAMDLAPAGVAATIIGLQPVFITIVGGVWQRRMPSLRVVAGTLIAFSGTALLCLR
ncbi:DMT family transporter [Desulfovibrio sp. OttesenSCG-928-A18]|nr:DMT family transporter [Desulfovibrio sp. OttesenSCG-928-A18]